MIKPKAKRTVSYATSKQIENLTAHLANYKNASDAKILLLESRISETHGIGREIIGMLPRVREVVAEQEAATLRTRIDDDKRFSKILDVKIAAINVAIGSINDEIRDLDRVVTRLQMRKKKKKS